MPWQLKRINPKGAKAEKSALLYLKKQGLKLLKTNFATRSGELDLIMLDANTLVFIEVRFRSTSHYGSALESITATKIKKIRMTAELFIQHHPQHRHKNCRFDAVTVRYDDDSRQNRLEWTKGAF